LMPGPVVRRARRCLCGYSNCAQPEFGNLADPLPAALASLLINARDLL